MNQTTTKTPPRTVAPFDTSIQRNPAESYAILNLMGTFTGTPQDLDVVEFAFMSPVMEPVSTVRLKVSETFYVNGQRAQLAETIEKHARKKGLRITFDRPAEWEKVRHLFNKNNQ